MGDIAVEDNITLGVAVNVMRLNLHNLAVYVYKNKYPIKISYYEDWSQPDYILTKTEVRTVDITFNSAYEYVEQNNVPIYKEYLLPDMSVARLYKNKK